jgi:mRNA-degrading endonuclease RelE of RelBE toxin-antitoxin system
VKVTQTPTFLRKSKKLHKGDLRLLEDGPREIVHDPNIGVLKSGDLGSIRVHKVRDGTKEYLIAYRLEKKSKFELIDFGVHENFYRDLKRRKS